MMPQEKRKWQTEMENKKRQLEDDRRALQHLKVRQVDVEILIQVVDPRGLDSEVPWTHCGQRRQMV